MAIVSQKYDFVIGVDTHAKTHTLCVIAASGLITGNQTFPASLKGMDRAIAWVARLVGAATALWSIEGTASYGATLTSLVTDSGAEVVEAPRMNPRMRRGLGKSDPIDAEMIARTTLWQRLDTLRFPRASTPERDALQTLIITRDDMTDERTAKVNMLTALLRTHTLGVDARKALTKSQINQIAAWRERAEDLGLAITRAQAVRLAKRILILDSELAANKTLMTQILNHTEARVLLAEPGIGPVTAAVVYTTWAAPGRLRDDAAYASLAGVNPIQASSGNTTKKRLNRGGDRRLNSALHMALLYRLGHHQETIDYVTRRTAEGMDKRAIKRILKRYLARQIYRMLQTTAKEATHELNLRNELPTVA